MASTQTPGALIKRRSRPFTVTLLSEDNRYLGQITSDSSIQRQAERDELKRQLDEPDKGGLTTNEEQQCTEAFARHGKLPRTYAAVWEDKHKRLEAHVIMHTARARAFQARDPALLKAEPESEHSEASDHHLDALDSPIHSPAQGPTTNDLQPPTTKTASISEVRPDSTKEDELIAGAKKGCNDVGAQTLGSGGHLHRKGPSMTGDKGSQPIIDLTNASDESEDMDVARSANAAPKKRREPKTQHKPTPANATSPSGPKGERREVPPTKRHHADGAKGSANKRKKQTATRTPTTVGTSSRPTQGRKPPLPSSTVINYSAPGAASQLFEPVLGAGTSVIRDSEEPEEWEASYKEFLPME